MNHLTRQKKHTQKVKIYKMYAYLSREDDAFDRCDDVLLE